MKDWQKTKILFEDEHILLVCKPPNIPVVPERSGEEENCLRAKLEKNHGKLFVVHRLDLDTSGLLLFARNEASHRTLSMAWQERRVEKHYLAIVDGIPHSASGSIMEPIRIMPSGRLKVHPKGKDCHTDYKVLESFGGQFSLLRLELHTGRTHQIRIHLRHIGNPLIVDPLYGKRDGFLLSEIKRSYKQAWEEERPLLNRLSLHASMLSFDHPKTAERMRFEQPLLKDMDAVLKQFRKLTQ